MRIGVNGRGIGVIGSGLGACPIVRGHFLRSEAPLQLSDEGLNIPCVWRRARGQPAAKVDAPASNGMDEIEIPALLRKQAD